MARLVHMTQRIDYFPVLKDYTSFLVNIESRLARGRLEPSLIKLVKMRASQLNQCSYCLHMHVTSAIGEGEAVERLALSAAFRESGYFSPREKAAMAWTEEVTLINQTAPSEESYQNLLEHFDEEEICELTLAISMINLWNRMAVSMRSAHPLTPLSYLSTQKAAE